MLDWDINMCRTELKRPRLTGLEHGHNKLHDSSSRDKTVGRIRTSTRTTRKSLTSDTTTF
jgi:hypothetical protein